MRPMKNHLIGIGILMIAFVGTIFIRADEFGKPMGGKHEWIFAHSLVTMEIWNQNGGPSAFGFNPVYSYPNTVNFKRRAMGGVTDENGLHYYTSYPPFAFIFGYYGTQLMGGPTVTNLRILSYLIHFLCGLLLFFIFYELLPDKGQFNLAGIIAGFLYFYALGFLWGHGFLYFVDTLEQLLILLCIYVSIRFWKDGFKNKKIAYSLLFLSFFMASYTEWLGLFFAFFIGLTFLIAYFIQKKKSLLFGFLVIGISASLAIGITVLQFSSVEGWDKLVEVSTDKYNIRSGHMIDDPKVPFHVENEDTYKMLYEGLGINYKLQENLTGAFALLFIPLLIFRPLRKKLTDIGLPLILCGLLGATIFLHYYLFFNFNALHEFSGLKFGLILTLGIGLLIMYIMHAMPNKKVVWIVGIMISGFILFNGYTEIDRYENYVTKFAPDLEMVESSKIIGAESDPDKGIFAQSSFHPIKLYYSKRDWFRTDDTNAVSVFMTFFNSEESHYYLFEGSVVHQMIECEKKGGEFRTFRIKNLRPANSHNKPHYFIK